jgi:large subunit ribosomal protein L21
MFAVVKSGGKQYKVAKDEIITVEKLSAEPGDIVELTDVLMLGEGDKVTLGTPMVAGATVAAEVVEQGRGPKILVFRKRRRQNFRRRRGHRQDQTILKVTEILTDGKKPAKQAARPAAKPVEKAEAVAPTEKPAAKTPAAKPAPAKKAAAPEKAPAKTEAKKAPAKKAPAKAAAKKADDGKKPAAKKAPAKKPAAKKTKE